MIFNMFTALTKEEIKQLPELPKHYSNPCHPITKGMEHEVWIVDNHTTWSECGPLLRLQNGQWIKAIP
jgi:hypothetical protein